MDLDRTDVILSFCPNIDAFAQLLGDSNTFLTLKIGQLDGGVPFSKFGAYYGTLGNSKIGVPGPPTR